MTDSPYALKYRPKTLEQVIGQNTTVQAISNAFKSDSLHHAYIMAGNLGSGKTSTARIMAAMENCTKKSTEPCGECQNCKEIFAGRSLDVKEIDAASNRSIDDIRGLKEEAQFSPVTCKTKYFILDEAHSLTGHAAEAALKLIEEPPKLVRFILCTTAAHKLIDTIHSRCIFFKFSKVSWVEIFNHLKQIAVSEKLDAEEEALKLAAKAAGGSVRNSLQNLQSMVAFVGGETITAEKARQILGVSDDGLYFDLIDAMAQVNAPQAVLTISKLLEDGRDVSQIVDGLERHLRNLMITLTCAKKLPDLGFLEDEIVRYRHQLASVSAGNKKIDLILKWIAGLYEVNKGLNVNLDFQTLLETYAIEAMICKKKMETAQ